MSADATTLAVPAVVFLATLIRSAFGFGEALVSVPLLALLIPVKVAVPLAVLLSVTVAAVILAQDWRQVHLRSAWWLTVSTMCGIPLGLWLLTALDEAVVKAVLAGVIIAFSMYSLFRRRHLELKDDRLAPLFGFGAGVLGGAYGMNGPPLVIYGTLRRWSPQHFRATLQGYFLPASLVGMAGYWWNGLWVPDVTWYFLVSLPVALAAVFLGRAVNRRMQGSRFVVYIYTGLLLVGVTLLAQSALTRPRSPERGSAPRARPLPPCAAGEAVRRLDRAPLWLVNDPCRLVRNREWMGELRMRRGHAWTACLTFCLTAGATAGPPVATATGPRPTATGKVPAYDPKLVARLVVEARTQGDARRGADVFRSPQFACLSCHQIAHQGGTVGPDLTLVARCLSPEKIVESVLWPRREIKEGYLAVSILTADGKLYTGYVKEEGKTHLVLLDPARGTRTRIAKADIDERHEVGTLMPDGLTAAMSPGQLRDLLRFLMGLDQAGGSAAARMLSHEHRPATFPFVAGPLVPELWPNRHHHVNRDRLYDFYAKEAEYFRTHGPAPALLPEYPGLDGGTYGHWGNQNEATWADDRWNRTELGTVLCGVFHGPGVTVPKGVCVRLGDRGEVSACFNPETLCYEALWRGGFIKFSPVRHGFMEGLHPAGTPLPRPAGAKPARPFVYHGFYRHGKRVVFSYRLGDVEMLDAPWAEGGKFTRLVAPAAHHPLARLTCGGPAQWPQVLETHATLGRGGPYVVDTIPPPFDNPWKAPLFFGDHDFLPDGTAFLCTMQGDVWRVTGLDAGLRHVRWRRFASGLHQALGLVAAGGDVYVLGRDQITRLRDLNGDGEADFYECVSNVYHTSAAGHDFICGLQRDATGRFYTASGPQGLLRIAADGRRVDVLATGMRNPDGVGLLPDGSVTVPCSEGEWTPASMVCLVRPGQRPAFFGYRGPRDGKPPDLPFVYLPRGLDNSSGGQVYVSGDRWGPLKGKLVHFSYGSATHLLLLTEEVEGQVQGAAVPLPGDFNSGVHRGRFNPKDGQLYVSGMDGWGTYAVADGCFQRVRYTGAPVQLPCEFHARENGVLVRFTRPLDRGVAEQTGSHFVQAWNYRYSAAYGSPEFSPRHPGTPGHDPLAVTSAHVLADGHTLFLEIPDLQPVNQLHLHLRVDGGPTRDVFATVHRLGPPFRDFAGYRPAVKHIASHPILADLALATQPRPANPWRRSLPHARTVTMEAGKNLSFVTPTFRVRAGEAIQLHFTNPDVVPHNWVLVQPGALERVGDLVNRLVAEPDAAVRQYIPRTSDVLAYTNIVPPGEHYTIYFRAPARKGRYPFLCTFPGHWMAMNGQMIVE